MREEKGKSLLASPNDFIVLDIETTGYLPQWDYIIEVGAIKYEHGVEIARFSSLIQPPSDDGEYIDSYITELTGITNEMLASAPSIESVLPKLYDFLDNFEEFLEKPLSNDFVDTMRLSRNLHPEEKHHRLSDLCERYALDYSYAHRPIKDCELTLSCYNNLLSEINDVFDNFDSFLQSRTRHSSQGVKAKDIHSEKTEFDITERYVYSLELLKKCHAKTQCNLLQILAELIGIQLPKKPIT